MERVSKRNYYLDIAQTVLERATCLRRVYGAIIVKNDEIISTGYNGAPRGRKNCVDLGYCTREQLKVPRGERYELCRSVHAEANAIISAQRRDMVGATIYLVGRDARSGELLHDTTSCAMCRRMIITSGYNVYPGQLENIIDGYEKVLLSCVIGVKDPYKVQKVKAFVKLVPGVEKNDETKHAIMEYCRKYVAKYAMPYDIEFRDELPKTLVGKVAYRILEEEEADRQATQEAVQAAQDASENK